MERLCYQCTDISIESICCRKIIQLSYKSFLLFFFLVKIYTYSRRLSTVPKNTHLPKYPCWNTFVNITTWTRYFIKSVTELKVSIADIDSNWLIFYCFWNFFLLLCPSAVICPQKTTTPDVSVYQFIEKGKVSDAFNQYLIFQWLL